MVTMVNLGKWNPKWGYVYEQIFATIENNEIIIKGGSCFWNNEDLFEPLKNTEHKIMAEIFYKKKEKIQKEIEIETLKSDLDKLNYTLDII